MFAANIATQCAALLVRRERYLLVQRRALVHRREEWNGSTGHFGSGALIHKRSDAIARLIADAEEFVFHFIRQAVRHRVVVIHNIPYFFSTHIAVTCIQRFRSFVTGSVGVFFFFAVRQRINKADFASARVRGYLAGVQVSCQITHLNIFKCKGFNIKLDQLGLARVADAYRTHSTGGVVVAQHIAFLLGNGAKHKGGGFMRLGCVAVLTHIQVQHHRVIWVSDGGRMSPCMLCIQHQVVLHGFCQRRIVCFCIRVQTVCKLPTVVGILVVLDRIGGTADTIGPPVRPVTAVNRCIRKFRCDGSVQLLQRNHLNAYFLTVLFVVSTDGFHNLGRRRRIIAENTGHCGYNEIVWITLGFTFGQILVKICMQLIREGSAGVGIFTQTVAHHPVDSVVGLKPQHIAQIIMFAVPDQQPLSGSVFPEESILVLVQRIHTVVAVNIREEELHTVFNHGVTVAHGESIDIGCHGCVNFCAKRLQLVLPFGQTLAEYIRIDKIVEVQIVGRNTDFAFLDKTGKVGAILLAGLFPELLYAVQRFAVPAEVSIFRLTHHGQHGFDIVDLNCNNAFLQICVAYVRVGMVDNIDRLDGMCHDKIPPNI